MKININFLLTFLFYYLFYTIFLEFLQFVVNIGISSSTIWNFVFYDIITTKMVVKFIQKKYLPLYVHYEKLFRCDLANKL